MSLTSVIPSGVGRSNVWIMIAARANFNYRPGKLYKSAPAERANAPRVHASLDQNAGCSVNQRAAVDTGSEALCRRPACSQQIVN